jgi:hypothetical protein
MAAPMAALRSAGIHRLIVALISVGDLPDQEQLSLGNFTVAG